jgi:hypothetical protein
VRYSSKEEVMKIIDGRVEDVVKPSPRYAEAAAACREMDMDIADDDYERIDSLLEDMWVSPLFRLR